MKPVIKNIEPQLKGDTFYGARFTMSPPTDLTGATIRTQFKRGGKTNAITLEISVGNGMTFEDALNGVFAWDQINQLNWAVGTYFWDVEITFINGEIQTVAEGSFPVNQDTSY